MINRKRLVLLFLVALLTGCATTGMNITERGEAYDKFISNAGLTEIERIRSFDLQGWDSLSNRHLILTGRFNRPYLVELRKECIDLYRAQTLIVNYTSVLTKLDTISVVDGLPIRCRIKRIFELSKEQKAALLNVTKTEQDS
jgi:hypothetical protein